MEIRKISAFKYNPVVIGRNKSNFVKYKIIILSFFVKKLVGLFMIKTKYQLW